MRLRSLALSGIAGLFLAACGARTQPAQPAPEWNDPGYVTQGRWSMYYAALPARDLAPELARDYGVATNPSRVLVSVSIADTEHAPPPATTRVTIDARTLSGVSRATTVRRVERDGVASWLGELDVSEREMIVFSVEARIDAQSPPLKAEFRREFYLR